MSPRRTADQAEQTKRKLLRVARGIWSQFPYHVISAEQLVRQAKLSRGALYHHFGRGMGPFYADAVVDAMQDFKAQLLEAIAGVRKPLEALEKCVRAYVALAATQEYRWLLLYPPSVMRWHYWREADLENGLGVVRDVLAAVAKQRPELRIDVDAATHVLAGALMHASLAMAETKDAEERKRIERTLLVLVRGLVTPQ
jgi:AcrR family transcriptional regulator